MGRFYTNSISAAILPRNWGIADNFKMRHHQPSIT